MKICIIYSKRVPKWSVKLAECFLSWLAQNQTLNHSLQVYLLSTNHIKTCKGPAWGFFSPGCRPTIAIACKRPGLFSLLDTLAHEWCEYEKWRDGKVRNHRGLQNRVDALIQRFHLEIEK